MKEKCFLNSIRLSCIRSLCSGSMSRHEKGCFSLLKHTISKAVLFVSAVQFECCLMVWVGGSLVLKFIADVALTLR